MRIFSVNFSDSIINFTCCTLMAWAVFGWYAKGTLENIEHTLKDIFLHHISLDDAEDIATFRQDSEGTAFAQAIVKGHAERKQEVSGIPGNLGIFIPIDAFLQRRD
jgi:hypothetical protein